MLRFKEVGLQEFLTDYWQKKPLIFRQALPGFINPLDGDELAGLAMEDEIESRLVIQTPHHKPQWHLKRGPLKEKDFQNLSDSHWTLLVQGVDRFIPEVAALLNHFNFLPQWRVDDVMISYAVEEGSVGPHYDNYDVFLFQAQGRRKWSLTTKDCVESNYLPDSELRIMKNFATENEFILEEGDMLYLPPHVAHHGISLSDNCITYSFGFRSYQRQELWDNLGEYFSSKNMPQMLYKDPDWVSTTGTSEIPEQAWLNAREILGSVLKNDELIKDWFGTFATSLDQHAESILQPPSNLNQAEFLKELSVSTGLVRNSITRMAYYKESDAPFLSLYINGQKWSIESVSTELIKKIADNREINSSEINALIQNEADQHFLYKLWHLNCLEYSD